MLSNFFIVNPDPALVLSGSYDYSLVFLSIIVSIFTAFLSAYLLDLAKETPFDNYRRIANVTASIVLSGGVWSMHFIGMLAFSLCTEINYDPLITFFSFFPAFIAFFYTITLLQKRVPTALSMLVGAVLLGSGIGTMHYSGMAAMQLSPMLGYDPLFFGLSILVAVFLSYVALFTRFNLHRYVPKLSKTQNRFCQATVLGLAVSGMHYMGMFATRFVSDTPFIPEKNIQSELTFVAVSVALATVLLTIIVVVLNSMIRYRILLDEKSASESRIDAILSTAIDGIVTIDEKGIILSFNNAAESIFGWQRHEVLNKNIKLLMADEIAQHHDGYLANANNVNYGKVIGINRDVHAKHKDGHLFPIRLGIGEVKQAGHSPLYVGFITDLTDQKALQQTLIDKEQQYRSLITNMPGVAFRCEYSDEWPMIYISPSVLELTGYTDEMFLTGSIHFGELIIAEHQELAMVAVTRALQEKRQYAVEYQVKHKNGELIWILDQGSFSFDDNGKAKWIDGVLVDITERRHYEDTLKQAKLVAEQAAKTKQAFLSNMSHEIRTPMNSIIGFSDLLMTTELNQEQQKHLVIVNNAAKSLLRLLNEILDSAKLEKGKLTIEPVNFNLHELLDSVISTLWLDVKNKGIELILDAKIIEGKVYFADPDRIRQVLMNLIGNAIKFTEVGFIKVVVTAVEHEQLKFEVIDTGIGIPKHRIKAVFEAFEQADGTVTRRFGGTGLGTSISKQLVELMGGSIGLTSEEGKGSCFYFTLPLKAGDINQTQAINSANSQLPPLTILVADDIAQNSELLSILLKKDQHQVVVANNGLEAIAAFEQQQFDVILMDIHMPECDGIDATIKIRQIEKENNLATTPIIALTASVLEHDKTVAKNAGMNGFANKPIDIEQLNLEIMQVLNLGRVIAPKAETTSASLKHIDNKKGQMLWGTKEKHWSEIARFLTEHKQSLTIISTQHSETEEHVRLLHTLKGLAGNLALPKLMNVIATLEKGEQDVELSEVLAELSAEVVTLEQLVLSDEQQQKSTIKRVAQQLSNDELLTLCEQLLVDVQNAELNDELLLQLSESAPCQYQSEITALVEQFELFDFDSAQSQLEQIINQLVNGK
ncbi:MHYT domain-containing protein [Thalassotalea agariperforans]